MEYVRVKDGGGVDEAALARMLEHSKGGRRVPVIVENDRVTIGFGGT